MKVQKDGTADRLSSEQVHLVDDDIGRFTAVAVTRCHSPLMSCTQSRPHMQKSPEECARWWGRGLLIILSDISCQAPIRYDVLVGSSSGIIIRIPNTGGRDMSPTLKICEYLYELMIRIAQGMICPHG